jgi:hypothetical protein
MLTSKSPRKVLLVAYEAARRVLRKYSCKFSRHDFTWPQLFACLVLREHQKKSYRGIEALLRDTTWWQEIGMPRAPDHNTLCAAFHAIITPARAEKMLDLLAGLWKTRKGMTVGVDSTYLDTHHHSRHYEHRCRKTAGTSKQAIKARQRARVLAIPKLAISVNVATHWILAVQTRVGMCGDQRAFPPLLRQTCTRASNVKTVLADAGFDSHANHLVARRDLGVRALIKAQTGRPAMRAVTSPFRRTMIRQLHGSQAGKVYGQRAQVETVNSMIKRNLGDSLRAHSATARCTEMFLRAITHNVMIAL